MAHFTFFIWLQISIHGNSLAFVRLCSHTCLW